VPGDGKTGTRISDGQKQLVVELDSGVTTESQQ
jgi:hypothetical protein